MRYRISRRKNEFGKFLRDFRYAANSYSLRPEMYEEEFTTLILDWVCDNDKVQLDGPKRFGIHPTSSSTQKYFVTTKFDHRNSVFDAEKNLIDANQIYSSFRLALNNRVQARNKKPKNRILMPISYDFYDFPGSKFNHPNYEAFPHVHSLFSVHPAMIEKFECALNHFSTMHSCQLRERGLREIHWERKASSEDHVYDLLKYSAKSLTAINALRNINIGVRSMIIDCFQ